MGRSRTKHARHQNNGNKSHCRAPNILHCPQVFCVALTILLPYPLFCELFAEKLAKQSLRSVCLPTIRQGTPGQWWWTSGNHFSCTTPPPLAPTMAPTVFLNVADMLHPRVAISGAGGGGEGGEMGRESCDYCQERKKSWGSRLLK